MLITVTIALLCSLGLAILEARTLLQARRYTRAKETLRRAIGHRIDLDASASRLLECALIEVRFAELHFEVEKGRIY